MAITLALVVEPRPGNVLRVTNASLLEAPDLREDFGLVLSYGAAGEAAGTSLVPELPAQTDVVELALPDGCYWVRLYLLPLTELETSGSSALPGQPYAETFAYLDAGLRRKLAKLNLHSWEAKTHKAQADRVAFERKLIKARLFYAAQLYKKADLLLNSLKNG